MQREFIVTTVFRKQWSALELTDDDLRELEIFLMQNPSAGDIIKGTGGLRKLRWKLPNRGKSGGARVLYIDVVAYETTILVNCYGKSERDNISEREKSDYKSFIKQIEEELRK